MVYMYLECIQRLLFKKRISRLISLKSIYRLGRKKQLNFYLTCLINSLTWIWELHLLFSNRHCISIKKSLNILLNLNYGALIYKDFVIEQNEHLKLNAVCILHTISDFLMFSPIKYHLKYIKKVWNIKTWI